MSMKVYSRRQLMAENYIGKPPKGYKWIEYIENKNNAYLNLGVVGKYNTKMSIEFNLSTFAAGKPFVQNKENGWTYPNETVCFIAAAYSANFRILYGITNSGRIDNQSVRLQLNMKHTFELGPDGYYFDGMKKADTSNAWSDITKVTGATIKIFTTNKGSLGKIYSVKLYEGDTMLIDGKPAIDSNGIAGIYNLVNDTFMKSASSTNFVAGPIIR